MLVVLFFFSFIYFSLSQSNDIEKFKNFLNDTGRIHLYSKLKSHQISLSLNKNINYFPDDYMNIDTLDLQLSKSVLIDFAPYNRNTLAIQSKFVGINIISVLKYFLKEIGIWPDDLSELEKDAIWRKKIEQMVSEGKL